MIHEINRLSNQTYWSNPKRYPPVAWAVDTIAALDPNHRIFNKNYIAKPKTIEPEDIFDNHDGLLDGFIFTGKGSAKKVKRESNIMTPKNNKNLKI